jgi:hypothetical protein
MVLVAKYPDSTKTSLAQRLTARARERWPALASIAVRHRGAFSYVDGVLADGTTLRLCRLRYIGSAHDWRFAIYRASHDDYDDSIFPTGLPVGTCEDALDVACGLYLADPTAWTRPPTNLRPRPLRSSRSYTSRARLAAAERLRALLLERGPRLARLPGAADAGAAGDRDGGRHRMHVAGQVRQQAGELGERVRRGQLVRGRLVPIVDDQDEAAALAGELR